MKRRSQHTTGKASRKPLGGLTKRERALREAILREAPTDFKRLERLGCDPDVLLILLVQWAWNPSLIVSRVTPSLVASTRPTLLEEGRRITKAVKGLQEAANSSHPSFLKSAVYEVLPRLGLALRFDQMERLRSMKERDRRSTMSLDILYWVKGKTGKFCIGTVAKLLSVTATFFNRGNNLGSLIYPPTKQSLQALLKRRRTSKQYPKGDDDPLKFGPRVV